MSSLSSRLTILRNKKGWSKVETAKRLGLNATSTYGNWEYGIREPDIAMLRHIATTFDVSVDYLIGYAEESSYKPSTIVKKNDVNERLEKVQEKLRYDDDLLLSGTPLVPEVGAFIDDSLKFVLEQAHKLNEQASQ
ncbi:helix-turn-helix domain-containing protein [Listeria booriae]|uniref:Helix-turn-helix transcriptional regulator n=1 Tax=Listeria booriae TaxID=1552123 RepID=A0A7X0WDI1_9LIST|nr:helix-turn-helix transcriptional regulator [Listeria booriae]MBC1272176.1 helix-turn-helix transcriptional regulator [Listeria booriae]MBC1287380.1 helix-turn-helix transcriptional regulator [Listeria booriae]MBC1331137.1 helix-turn-helix transcriptional regulator [Listeria booriae]MBC2386447.1 helix-turn-helix transcriptional regulator [Listeria booriae]